MKEVLLLFLFRNYYTAFNERIDFNPLIFFEGETCQMKLNFKPAIQSMAKSVSKHSPEILTGSGITFMITATILAIKATPKAQEKLAEVHSEKYSKAIDECRTDSYEEAKQIISDMPPIKLTPVEVVKTVWKDYIPTAVATVTGAACLVASTKISVGRTAIAAFACKASEQMYDELESSVKKTFGDKKAQEVRDNVIREHMDRTSDNMETEVFDTGHGNTLCYDCYSDRYFLSNVESIRQAMNAVVARAAEDARTENGIAHLYLNDFYEEIGLNGTKSGGILGWRFDVDRQSRPSIIIGAIPTKYGSAANTVDFNIKPNYDVDF